MTRASTRLLPGTPVMVTAPSPVSRRISGSAPTFHCRDHSSAESGAAIQGTLAAIRSTREALRGAGHEFRRNVRMRWVMAGYTRCCCYDISTGEVPMQSAARPDSSKLLELTRRFSHTAVPLTRASGGDDEARAFAQSRPDTWFPGVRSPGGAVAGLLLIAGCWSEAHDVASELDTPEGSYWHALIHRMEPDTWNSNYWFRSVGP